jgi:hypothetical protein
MEHPLELGRLNQYLAEQYRFNPESTPIALHYGAKWRIASTQGYRSSNKPLAPCDAHFSRLSIPHHY